MMVKKWLKGAKTSISVTLLTGIAAFAAAPLAQAGFEWTPPPAKQTPAAVPAVPAPAVRGEALDEPAPMPEINPQPLEKPAMAPVPEASVSEQYVAPAVEPQALSTESVYQAPVATAPQRAPVMAGTRPVRPVDSPATPAYEETVGFGSDIPLVLAMRQIVPPEFSFSFDEGVNLGARISWTGGRPWDEVLAEAVRPMDVHVVISGNTVWLRKGWYDSEAQQRMAPVAEPVPAPIAPPVSAVSSQQPALEMTPPTVEPVPLPLSAFEPTTPPAPAANQPADTEDLQSYPRRQRPVSLFPEEPAPTAPSAIAEGGSSPSLPIPLMKALPPPPEPADERGVVPSPFTTPSVVEPSFAPAAPVAPPPSPQAAVPAPERAVVGNPVMDPMEILYWQAEPGASLRAVMTDWAGRANVALVWSSPRDYMLPAPVRMHGTFPEAVTNLLTVFNAADPRPVGKLHPNLPQGPSVLVIENYTVATN